MHHRLKWWSPSARMPNYKHLEVGGWLLQGPLSAWSGKATSLTSPNSFFPIFLA